MSAMATAMSTTWAMAMAMRVEGDEDGEVGNATTMTTMAAGTDNNQLKAAADISWIISGVTLYEPIIIGCDTENVNSNYV